MASVLPRAAPTCFLCSPRLVRQLHLWTRRFAVPLPSVSSPSTAQGYNPRRFPLVAGHGCRPFLPRPSLGCWPPASFISSAWSCGRFAPRLPLILQLSFNYTRLPPLLHLAHAHATAELDGPFHTSSLQPPTHASLTLCSASYPF
ncbi:hypothetical protein BCV70DRAFT_28039 [Testicularia cyperi]|uniref:Uncharacterized protein n=1 Tax=Testicularia cyperi TaxID=1882483 RepID=A0A317XLR2_9BASI|nr:hypothetical protein BCV70DRAFT_28039 [Testicularia cyperi]